MIANQPSMNSIIIGRYISTNSKNPRRGYQDSYVVTT
jgi:hypothetical protein